MNVKRNREAAFGASPSGSSRAEQDSAGGDWNSDSNLTSRIAGFLGNQCYRYCSVKRGLAITILAAAVGSSCSANNDGPYTEYFPKSDGDKPEEFNATYTNSCRPERTQDLVVYLSSVEKFALSRHMLRIAPTNYNSKIVEAYSRGAPMKVHLLVERADDGGVMMSISTLGGLECEDCAVARETLFPCPS